MKKEKMSKRKEKKMQEASVEETKKEEDMLTDTDEKTQEEAKDKEVEWWQKTCLEVMKKEEVLKTLQPLLKLVKKDRNTDLLSDDKAEIYLQFAVKKIPKVQNKIIKLRLPHSVWKPGQEVCLFVKDINKTSREHEVTERHFKDLLSSKGINCITQVIPMKCLKLEYKPYEAKRNLSNMFDLFVADERIIRLLPSLLGRNFYGKKKHPIQVNLQALDLKKEIDKVVCDSRCIISGQGATSTATVGYSDMSAEQLADNVMKAMESIAAALPGGAVNIQSVYVRTEKSLALPLFATFSSKREVKLPKKPVQQNSVVGELSTLMTGHVLVTKMGNVVVGNLDESGKFNKMKQRQMHQKTTKRKIDEESDDEMVFEEVQQKKRKTNFRDKQGKKFNTNFTQKNGKKLSIKSKTNDSMKIKDSLSSVPTPEATKKVTSKATPEMKGRVSSKAVPGKGKKVLLKTTQKKAGILTKAASKKGEKMSKATPEKAGGKSLSKAASKKGKGKKKLS
ncbi:ribosomal L1 domain-containing protein 1-like [Mizuhopecten yessoensis]|uniref:Ribosomal L1 domain-containing protein 1 n=1 Tax=Mizuhopecten yessoensis TaxID=6573 RepID=A0A210QQ97_MIZYE|nr:ribosomal L1 domain-containing protein 1-like [Mizuhopecten yessoensis]OWF50905.1 Ribosomal L1 domain-containing protein 1 [Mizuhopecten yessoensis]